MQGILEDGTEVEIYPGDEIEIVFDWNDPPENNFRGTFQELARFTAVLKNGETFIRDGVVCPNVLILTEVSEEDVRTTDFPQILAISEDCPQVRIIRRCQTK